MSTAAEPHNRRRKSLRIRITFVRKLLSRHIGEE